MDILKDDCACPQPGVWDRIYRQLREAWTRMGSVGEPPPTPIILGGWWYTPALPKILAWQATIRWAAERNLSHLIPELNATEWASISDASGVEEHSFSHHDPAPVPSEELLTESLQKLRHGWAEVAGALANCTSPARFSGGKGRNLIVYADYSKQPPWGEWKKLIVKAPFSELRRKVNEVISPHYVDSIEFRPWRV